jgi:hypothetical protein
MLYFAVRRTIVSLSLAGALLAAAQPAAARDLHSRRPAAGPHATAPGPVAQAWSWLTHLLAGDDFTCTPTPLPPKPPTTSEGPFMDPNGVH